MGGTIRAAWNLAGYLARHGYDVEIVSLIRRREEPFFGAFPPGVRAMALDDRRPSARPTGLRGLVRKVLKARSSVLVHQSDRAYGEFSLWSDVRLVRCLRRRTGFVVGTRPAFNMLLADMALPGLVTVGLEQMHMNHHVRTLRRAVSRRYHKLDALVVLTEQDVANYQGALDGRGRIVRIPNTVREMGGASADLSATTVLAAGRLRIQKGYDLLIPAWAQVAADHPDWRLRICGEGRERGHLRRLIKEHRVGDTVALEGPLANLGEEMEKASIFPLSSRFEGFPLILLEAMSKGMAVISFDCPTGPADIIEDHRNGILVPREDVDAFAAGLRELIDDEALRRRCAAAAPATAQRYTMEAIGPQWTALLERLARERDGAR
jgi:glycosyltransferase involved in cell wall biosynthesis